MESSMPLHETATYALAELKSNQRVFIQGASATPIRLIEGLINRAPDLRNVELMHLHTLGDAAYAQPAFAASFRVANLFLGENMRPLFDLDRIDYLPCFLSELPRFIRSRRRPIDFALIHVSPPDTNGYCSLGTSLDTVLAACDVATVVVAQINRRMPRVHGPGQIHVSRIHHWIEIDEPLPESHDPVVGETDRKIGSFVAQRVDNGATLQVGIGSIPNAVVMALRGHKHLGIHTETWGDSVLDLIQCGAVDNSRKKIHAGKTVSTFLMGTKRLFDFVDDNPDVLQLEANEVNSIDVIMKNPKVVAINSATEVDLTGQVCADSIGHRVISGIGGQLDFIRGAALSEGGQPIIAIPTRTKRGEPRIVPELKPGAGVVTTRGHIHVVITEYGIADLYGMTLSERAQALIQIAHPDDRESLSRAWHNIARSL
jgi:4-hydroxybutyrate CoA-transferase